MATIRMPCPHEHCNTLLPPSSRCDGRRFEVKLIHRVNEHITFRRANCDGQDYVTYRPSDSSIISAPVNPFCRLCRVTIIKFYMNLGNSEGHSNSLFDELKYEVEDELNDLYNNLEDDYDYVIGEVETCNYINHVFEYDKDWVEIEKELSIEETSRPTFTIRGASTSSKALARSTIEGNDEDSCISSTTTTASCVICFEDLRNTEEESMPLMMIKTLPCTHEFHQNCIDEWLYTSNVCPLCRFEVPMDVDFSSY